MVKFFNFAKLAAVLLLVVIWMRGIFVESNPINPDHIDEVEGILDIGSDNASLIGTAIDRTEYELVLRETDPTTGAIFYAMNGSPVQGRLKAYLEDESAQEGRFLGYLKTHPDGESATWVIIPKPLFLLLTDQSPSQ